MAWLLFYAAVAAVTLGANPFKNETITPFDVLVSQRAWAFVDPDVQVRNYQRSDILNSRLPQWESAKQQVRSGHFPLWNDRIAGGGTFLTVNTNMYTPAFLVFVAVPDSALGFHLGILLTLALGGLGMHLFLRRYLGLLASIAGAVTFELCGFNAAWLYWPHVFTLIWAPWLLWAIHRCACKPGMGNALLVAAPTALVALGGFPFLSILILEAAALYALVLLLFMPPRAPSRLAFAGWCFSGTLFGLLLAALPLIGLFYWLQQFDLGYREGRGSYLAIEHLRQLLPPWAYQTQRVEETMYVGTLMLALAGGALVTMAARRRRIDSLTLFGLLLLAITAGLVFDLWPMWLVQWLPGMSFNAWSRAIGLFSIALIILGAATLDQLWELGRKNRLRFLRPLAVTVVLLQVVEISMFFRDFNGPVSADYYFPETPTIEYVRQQAGPFDYVVTDRSFVMSGTLGVYGLREWLAHYFRSPALQAALHEMAERPFHSHRASASRFRAAGIKYESPTMADYNVRYVLIDSRHGPDAGPVSQPPDSGKHRPLPPMPQSRYLQEFPWPDHSLQLSGISVRLATYEREKLPGRMTLAVHDATGTRLDQASVNARAIVDNKFTEFWFNRPLALAGQGPFLFSLDYRSDQAEPLPITAWAYDSSPENVSLRINGEPDVGTIQYRLHAKEPGASRFERVFTAAGTAVFENNDSPRGPYFLTGISEHAQSQSGTDVVIDSYRPEEFTLRYTGATPGYVVVPMSMHPDWRVTLDGNAVRVQAKDGVMPAVPVTGPATIHFRYRPSVLAWLYPWFGLLALNLLLMYLAARATAGSPENRAN